MAELVDKRRVSGVWLAPPVALLSAEVLRLLDTPGQPSEERSVMAGELRSVAPW